MAVTITIDVDGEELTHTFDPVETAVAEVKLPGGAADTSLKLALLTEPTYLVVASESEEVTFKLESAGTDPIGAYPFAVVTNLNGLTLDEILLSNPGAGEATVKVWAGEE